MIVKELPLKGAFVIQPEKLRDIRGFFARIWDEPQFKKYGLDTKLSQCSISFNKKKGTLRGMHYQVKPFEETKFVRCTRGKIYDVIIDLRHNSKTFKKWVAITLSSANHKMIYIPNGFAHGFQTLEDNTEIFYQIVQKYMPQYARGIKWNDKMFRIKWPMNPTVISKSDHIYPQFDEK